MIFMTAGVMLVVFAATSAAAPKCQSDVVTMTTTFSMHSE